jgi:membrane-anchored protein YejM (alkaline phosphatase superfamily)
MPANSLTTLHTGAWPTAFVLVNALLASVIACSNIPLSGLDHWQAIAFLLLALPGHFLFFGAALVLPAWLLGRLSGRPRRMTAVAVVLQLLWIVLLVADAKVFALYRFHLNAMVANMLFGGALTAQVTFSAGMWAQIGGGMALLLGLELLIAWGVWRLLSRHPDLVRPKLAWSLIALWMVLGQGFVAYADARGDRAVLSQLTYIPWAQPITLKDSLHRLGVQTVQAAAPPDAVGGELGYPRQPLQCSTGKFNVLVVLVESLRFDALNERTMPQTWRYAHDAQWFLNHYSSGNATRFGLFGLMYGLPGGYWHPMLAQQRAPELIEQMRRDRYRMHLYGSAPLYSPEFDRTVFASVRERIVNGPAELPSQARDRVIVQLLQRDLRQHPRDERFFGFVFLDSPHAPYHIPAGFESPFQPMTADVNFFELDPDHDPTPVHNRYLSAVHYTDTLIGQLLDTVRDSGLADNTVVLITGDHGEEFNDLQRNYWGHNGNFSDYQIRTPYVLHWPGKAPRRIARISSHEDFAPTVLRHALQCRNRTAEYSTGHDLLAPLPASRALLVESWSQRAVRHGERIYLFDKFGATTVVDRNYRELEDERADPAAIGASWEMLTRFLKPQPPPLRDQSGRRFATGITPSEATAK